MREDILIQSESSDKSTDDVLAWIKHIEPNRKVEHLFDNYFISKIKVELSNQRGLELSINGIEANKKTAFWYRRGELNFVHFNDLDNRNEAEIKVLKEYLWPILSFINGNIFTKGINKFKDNYIGKLEMLNTCTSLNISIPHTLITDNLEELMLFLEKHKKIICKPVKNPFLNSKLGNKNISFYGPTELITKENIVNLPNLFLPCMFQEYIDKKIEIRSFFFFGKFFSMAIFSQNNPKTLIDFRNYDRERPSRNVPFLLPKNLESKLIKLMNSIQLNCGSFDIILTPEDEFVFLEINPIGQFQWLSRNCNYKIDKIIAEHLVNL